MICYIIYSTLNYFFSIISAWHHCDMESGMYLIHYLIHITILYKVDFKILAGTQTPSEGSKVPAGLL